MNTKTVFTLIALCMLSFRAQAMDYEIIDFKFTMPIDIPWMRVITNETEWDIFYNELASVNGYDVAQECGGFHGVDPVRVRCTPPVDFATHQIVVGGLGIRYSSANELMITGVSPASDFHTSPMIGGSTYVLNLVEISPLPGCVTLPVINHPMVGIAMFKTNDNDTIKVEMQRAFLRCN